MLSELKKHFELVIFTAGMSNYARPIINEINRIGETEFFDHIISRENCSPLKGQGQIKDLTLLLEGRDI
jgi:TFIIF-interacting CTD phosphatase-like protein